MNRIKATLARLGIRNFKPTLRKAAELCERLSRETVAPDERLVGGSVGCVHHCPGIAPRRARPPEERPSLLTV